jgi:hypothetical protein
MRESAAFLRHFIFVGGLIVIMVRLGLRSWFHFQQLHAEDGAVEMLTVAFFLLAAFHAHLVAVEHRRHGLKALAVLHWFGALAFFVIGMEELSWGQRQLMLETPESLAGINMQQELNLHNIQGIHGVWEIRLDLLLGAFGVFSASTVWLGRAILARQPRWIRWIDFLEHFTVPARFIPYFLAMYVYILLRRNDSALLYELQDRRVIKELMEMLFALGCYLTMFYRLRNCYARARE